MLTSEHDQNLYPLHSSAFRCSRKMHWLHGCKSFGIVKVYVCVLCDKMDVQVNIMV